jgi:hypothetical protein
MPLGQGIGEMMEAVRDRIEVSGTGPTWDVTAGSFDSALDYARERFGDPVVLARSDRNRWWPRVTLTVSTDPARAASAPALEDIRRLPPPVQPVEREPTRTEQGRLASPVDKRDGMPSSLAAIFDHQEELRIARQRTPGHDR